MALRSGAVVAGFVVVLALLIDGPSDPVQARPAPAAAAKPTVPKKAKPAKIIIVMISWMTFNWPRLK